jgi:hypothetical protein
LGKTCIVRAFSTYPELEKVVPIRESVYFLPKWYLKMPKYQEKHLKNKCPIGTGTAKNCPGIIDFFKSSLTIPSWCDYYVEVNEEGIRWQSSDMAFSATIHSSDQFVNFLPDHFNKEHCFVLKLVSPWRVETSKKHKLLFIPSFFNNLENNIEVIPGIRESSYYNITNVFLFFSKPGSYFIPRGAPLINLIPIRKEKIKLKISKMSEKDKLTCQYVDATTTTKFSNGYRMVK